MVLFVPEQKEDYMMARVYLNSSQLATVVKGNGLYPEMGKTVIIGYSGKIRWISKNRYEYSNVNRQQLIDHLNKLKLHIDIIEEYVFTTKAMTALPTGRYLLVGQAAMMTYVRHEGVQYSINNQYTRRDDVLQGESQPGNGYYNE